MPAFTTRRRLDRFELGMLAALAFAVNLHLVLDVYAIVNWGGI